jgi:D-alanyl-D-alanine carboxypeptidase
MSPLYFHTSRKKDPAFTSTWAKTREAISAMALVALVIVGVVWTGRLHDNRLMGQTAQVVQPAATTTAPIIPNPFVDMAGQLEAKSAFVYDIAQNKVLFNDHASVQLPLASLTKMMTMLVALDIAMPSLAVTITPDDLAPEGDSGFVVGEEWRLSDLIAYTLMVSSNDGATAIARTAGAQKSGQTGAADAVKAFVSLMNTKAREIGLSHTYFLNPTGLDIDSGVSGAYGTAEDVVKLAKYVWETHPEIFDATTRTTDTFVSLTGIEHHATNTH